MQDRFVRRSRRSTLVACLGIALASSISACEAGGSLAVQLVSDLDPGVEIDAAHVIVRSGPTVVLDARVPIDAARRLGRPTRLVQRDLAPGSYEVHLALEREGAVVQERDARPRVSGATTTTLLMLRDCTGVACPGTGGSPSELACLGGRCVPPECDEEHPELCPHPACTTSGDCTAATVSCVATECTASGVCFDRPLDERCGTGEVCMPSGCASATADAGPGDAGADAGASIGASTFLWPWTGAATGSALTPIGATLPAHPLRPTLRWQPVAGARSYRVLVDDEPGTCTSGFCTLTSALEVDTVQLGTSLTLEALPVASTPPLGRRYYAIVVACTATDGQTDCAWSRTRYFDVGRAPGDLDGDGAADLLVGLTDGAVGASVRAYSGRDLSPLPGAWSGPLMPEIVGLGDVDADRREDFVIVGTDVRAWTMSSWSGQAFADAGAGAYRVGAVGDVDADGYAELAIGAPTDTGGSVFLHFGSAVGPEAAPAITLTSGVGAGHFGSAIAGADLDSDGFLDVVVAGLVGTQPMLEVFFSHNWERGFSAGPTYAVTLPSRVSADVAHLTGMADFDGDDLPDVIATFPGTATAGIVTRDDFATAMISSADFATTLAGSALAAGPIGAQTRWTSVLGVPDRGTTLGAETGGALLADATTAPLAVRFASRVECCASGAQAGTAVTVADLDGEGAVEIVLGVPGTSSLHVVDGEDGTTRDVAAPAGETRWGSALGHE